MKNKLSLFLFLGLVCFGQYVSYSQKIWTKRQASTNLLQKKEIYQKKNFPSNYKILSLDEEVLKSSIQSKTSKEHFIELPDANGNLTRFKIKETSNFDKVLQAKYPNIKSFNAQSLDDLTKTAKISFGTDGFHAVIFSGHASTLYIDPYSRDNTDYIVYKRSSLPKADEDFKCMVTSNSKNDFSTAGFQQKTNDGKLRTFRMALACTGEYAQFHLGPDQQNIADTATESEKKASILSAMNTSMTRINGVFEREIAIKLELVSNNDELIFLDPNTDGMSDDNPDTLLGENQSICDATIGSANYDIGHVFSTSGGSLSGVAVLGSACIPNQKARGVTGLGSPVGDAYDIDLVIHELGHQFGATHTQNNDCNRTNTTAVEPGSGSTIMGYAGICSPNVQSGNPSGNSDDYFHAVSIAQMLNLLATSASCATLSDTNNATPTADAGADFSIPKATPFKLTGTATDADGTNSLTYNWEQIDSEIGTMPPLATNAQGPIFRSLPSKSVPVRYFPDLTTIVSGNTSSTWEVLPSVARELNFSFTVRDNNSGGGSTARDDTKIDVIDATPFSVATPNSSVSWDTGSTQTITWNKGETDTAPINCALVNIKLSIDGGVTFPITIKSNTPNDGTEAILIPDNPTTSARIMIEAADHIFYNVNTTNFIINSTGPTFVISNSDGLQTACNSGNETVTYNLNFDFINGFSETVTLSASGQPTGADVTFSASTINADGAVTMTISNLDNKIVEDYEIDVVATSTSVTQNLKLDFKLVSSEFGLLTLSSPANGNTNVNLTEVLQWIADTNATSYDVEIATDASFTNLISSSTVETNSNTTSNLISLTQYFWRVKPKNKCGTGNFSETFSFTTKQGVYCSSTFTDETNGSEYISNVTFGVIDNDSDNDTEDGYQDFTSISTLLFKGQQKQISVTFDTGGYQDHCYVFIDWNQDFEFDLNTERYDLGSRTEDIATATLNITIPDNARTGNTRMRVVLEYDDPDNGFGEGACDADHLTEWGETEDYTLTIIEPVGANNFAIQTTSESCQDSNDGIITVDIINTDYTYTLNVTGGTTNLEQNLTSTNFQLIDLAPGQYEVCITAIALNTTNCFEVTIEPAQQISLKVATENNSNLFSFEISQGSPPFEVFLNDNLVGVSSNYNFDLNINGTGILKVKTSKDCEGVFEKNINDLLSINNPTKRITLVQNPVKDFIEIQLSASLSNERIQAAIFDITGKLIYKQDSKIIADKIKIPFSNFAKGIYILKLSIQDSKPIKILKQ
tara:strand:+ start:9282 stop:13064 length:3783 start_codon:yes stop_codon:yes gene_type:complete